MTPQYRFSHFGKGRECHDSYLYDNVIVDGELRTLWVVSEGSGMKETIMDFTDVTPDTVLAPRVISTTPIQNGIYAHSSALSEKRILFEFDENNRRDIYVYDINNVLEPKLINAFQCSEESNAIPHNGEAKGRYLYVAYYEAGLRSFDVTNPLYPVEVGRVETWRDAGNSIQGTTSGAWNVYTGLKSGNILVTDMFSGLFIVKANAPYAAPDAPIVRVERNVNTVTVSWDSVANARAYTVERRIEGQAAFVVVDEFLTTTSYLDNSAQDKNVSYKVKAVNGEGTGVSPEVESTQLTASPTKAPTNQPTPRPTVPLTPNPTPPPSNAPTPQPSPNPTPLPSNSPTTVPTNPPSPNPTPFPTTAAPTKEVFYQGVDSCLRDKETQKYECFAPDISSRFPNGRAVNCCGVTDETLTCIRPDCSLVTSFSEAISICETAGLRLCSAPELETGVCCSQGCSFDFIVGWTTTLCDGTSQTPEPTAQPTTPQPTPPPPTPLPTPQPSDLTESPSTPIPTFIMTGRPIGELI